MGGALALASAVHSPDISASAPFYGTPPAALADVKTIKVPVLAQFGEEDDQAGFADVETAKSLEASLKQAGVEVEVIIHPGVGHGFMNATPVGKELNEKLGRPEHNPDVINLAWAKLLAFFAKHLE
jgi:carboxymethylenebutenolidase